MERRLNLSPGGDIIEAKAIVKDGVVTGIVVKCTDGLDLYFLGPKTRADDHRGEVWVVPYDGWDQSINQIALNPTENHA